MNTTLEKDVNTSFIDIDTFYIYTSLIKLLISAGMSFIIGFERELHTHPGGICTHTLVGFGACYLQWFPSI